MHTPPPPAELLYIATAIGRDATLLLVEKHGGCRIYIPSRPTARSRLATEIGLDAVLALAKIMGGDTLQVPLAQAWLVKVYTLRGESAAQIARRLRMTENTVYVLRRAMGLTAPAGGAEAVAP